RNLAASTVVRCTYALRRVHGRHLEEGHMMLAIASILLSALTAAPADVTGKWEGRLTATRSDGSTHEDTVRLILNQKDGTITGTIGGSENDQHAIPPARSTATRSSARRGPARTGGGAGARGGGGT